MFGFRVFKTVGSIRGVLLEFERVFKGLEKLVLESFQTLFFFLQGLSEDSDIKELGSVAFM